MGWNSLQGKDFRKVHLRSHVDTAENYKIIWGVHVINQCDVATLPTVCLMECKQCYFAVLLYFFHSLAIVIL